MHLAHPRTARDDRRSRPEHLRGTAEPPGRPLRIPYRIGISAGPLPGALTASGQHGHGPFPHRLRVSPFSREHRRGSHPHLDGAVRLIAWSWPGQRGPRPGRELNVPADDCGRCHDISITVDRPH